MSLPLPSPSALPPLPVPVTPLIGRERELADVVRLLQEPTTRLLTLTGLGGIGKTKLALHAAHALGDFFRNGVIFVPLAAISDARLVSSAIAGALNLRESDEQPTERRILLELKFRRALLFLDNFEHVIEAAPFLGELLASCPELCLLVTSRTALNLVGERRYVVPPLGLPTCPAPAAETLGHSAAVALFLERARAVQPALQLNDESAAVIADISQQLEGVPLAIELAAARLNLLTLQALRTRLSHRLALLTSGPRDLPAHQQTLRRTIGWSYDLLDDDEQQAFMSLSVFAGSWTLEAAEAVLSAECTTEHAQPHERTLHVRPALDVLSSLLDKSMIMGVDDPQGEPRFAMLETLREYALEQLNQAGKAAATRQRHMDYYASFAARAGEHLTGSAQQRWLERLELAHDNIRAALQHADGQHDFTVIASIGGAVWRFWHVHGYVGEGRAWLDIAAHGREQVAPELIARVFIGAGWLANVQNDVVQAEGAFQASLAHARTAHDRWSIGLALGGLGRVAHLRGNRQQATNLYGASLLLLRQIRATEEVAWTLIRLGILALERGESDDATRLFTESRDAFDALGFVWGRTWAQTYLADAARAPNAQRYAEPLYRTALAEFEKMGDRESAEDLRLRLEQLMLPACATGGKHASSDALSAREREVLRFVATGMTDAQVAAALVVSPRTVHAHLRSIYAKLGVSTRSAVTRIALERGFV